MALRLTDEQWDRIREHFPEENIPDVRPGRKPVPARQVLEGAFWILNAGWHILPQCYPNYKTVHRRFQQWCHNDVLRDALCQVANALRESGAPDQSECFIDASFSRDKGGEDGISPTKRGKGVKIMGIVNRNDLPLAVTTHAANHHEVTLVQLTFDFNMIEAKPEEQIGDKAYDSDRLDAELEQEGLEMIAPHRKNRKQLKTQDGQKLRRYQCRWLNERFWSWLHWQRRLVVSWENRTLTLGVLHRGFSRLRTARFTMHPTHVILR